MRWRPGRMMRFLTLHTVLDLSGFLPEEPVPCLPPAAHRLPLPRAAQAPRREPARLQPAGGWCAHWQVPQRGRAQERTLQSLSRVRGDLGYGLHQGATSQQQGTHRHWYRGRCVTTCALKGGTVGESNLAEGVVKSSSSSLTGIQYKSMTWPSNSSDSSIQAKHARLPAGRYMERYYQTQAKTATQEYVELAKKHGLTPTQLALAWCRSRWYALWLKGRQCLCTPQPECCERTFQVLVRARAVPNSYREGQGGCSLPPTAPSTPPNPTL
jgi:hypothetical protein